MILDQPQYLGQKAIFLDQSIFCYIVKLAKLAYINYIQMSQQEAYLKHLKHLQANDPDFNQGRWTDAQHKQFLEAIMRHGNHSRQLQKCIKKRGLDQIRSHSQKYFQKIKAFLSLRKKNRKKQKTQKTRAEEQLIKQLLNYQEFFGFHTPKQIFLFLEIDREKFLLQFGNQMQQFYAKQDCSLMHSYMLNKDSFTSSKDHLTALKYMVELPQKHSEVKEEEKQSSSNRPRSGFKSVCVDKEKLSKINKAFNRKRGL